MMEYRKKHAPTTAYEAEGSEGQERLPRFVQCKTCGNVIIRGRPCWYCPPSPVKQETGEPWSSKAVRDQLGRGKLA
jgi:hypothetical protein